jgi:3-hydroxyacyl-CoA dehydrogenase
MDEASKNKLTVEEADALMGRPMGIPKTGVFGLYDLIGIDLMSDVVNTLGDILPEDDLFHEVGTLNNPVMPLIRDMIQNGFTGDKGKGGFYRIENKTNCAVDLTNGKIRLRQKTLPISAQKAADAQAAGDETLIVMINGSDNHATFCKRFLARTLAYAADLIPAVTSSPQDIDDAMKLGFNWVRGPFELIDALGANVVVKLIKEAGLTVPKAISLSEKIGPFYTVSKSSLNVLNFENNTFYSPVILPENTIRFHMTKQSMTPLLTNSAASLYELKGNLRLLEFHSKANALTAESMEIVLAAAKNHGDGIIIHNDAQHFSAGVDLNRFRSLIEASNWNGIDEFLNSFQQSVKALKYSPVPVIGAPSGLSIGGGFEVLAHCDKLIAHTNTVFGLVETGVGVVPGGGGVKETLLRWYQATGDWEKASWNTWMQIGYGQIGTSPDLSARMQYYLKDRDVEVLNRDKLMHVASTEMAKLQKEYQPPIEPVFELPGSAMIKKMSDFMQNGINEGLFFPHDKTVAMQVAEIVVNSADENSITVSEQDMYDRERRAFLNLAKTPETIVRISSLLDTGEAIRN